MLLSSYDIDPLTSCLTLAELQAWQCPNLLAICLVVALLPSLTAGLSRD